MENKDIFAKNLEHQMKLHNVSRKKLSDDLGISYFTVSDWVNGKKYPRMEKVEMLANYFNVLKSDLIELKSIAQKETSLSKLIDYIVASCLSDDEIRLVGNYIEFLVNQRN